MFRGGKLEVGVGWGRFVLLEAVQRVVVWCRVQRGIKRREVGHLVEGWGASRLVAAGCGIQRVTMVRDTCCRAWSTVLSVSGSQMGQGCAGPCRVRLCVVGCFRSRLQLWLLLPLLGWQLLLRWLLRLLLRGRLLFLRLQLLLLV